jgi:hypothetical protein
MYFMTYSTFLLPQPGTLENVFQRAFNVTIRLTNNFVAGDERDVKTRLESWHRKPHGLTQQATYPVTHNGATEAPTDDKAIPIVTERVWGYRHR